MVDPEGQPSETRTLSYDGRDRLVGVGNAPSGSETCGYDPLDNVRRAVRNGVDRRFAVNPATQRLAQLTTVGSAATVDYGWNDRGELASRTTTTPTAPPAIVPPTIHRNGFEDATLVATDTFTFDRARRLVNYQSVPYQYDAHNHRVLTTPPLWGNRYQVYSRAGELLYVEDQGSKERTEFFHLGGTLVAERTRPLDSETATVNYLHSDHRGTPTVKTSTAGTRVYRSRLMPYGAPYDGIWRDGPGFTKHATDEVGSMVYMQQRYFDPALPTFISPDPVPASVENFNRYAYANNNPYTYGDPDGRKEKPFNPDVDAPRTARAGTQTPVSRDLPGYLQVSAYNCHSYAWHDSIGDPTDDRNSLLPPKWDNLPDDDMAEASRLSPETPNQVGDIVVYGRDEDGDGRLQGQREIQHSAKVTKVDEEGNTIRVESKEGEGPITSHHPSDQNPVYGNDKEWYRKEK